MTDYFVSLTYRDGGQAALCHRSRIHWSRRQAQRHAADMRRKADPRIVSVRVRHVDQGH
jgi:hypothetical protein